MKNDIYDIYDNKENYNPIIKLSEIEKGKSKIEESKIEEIEKGKSKIEESKIEESKIEEYKNYKNYKNYRK